MFKSLGCLPNFLDKYLLIHEAIKIVWYSFFSPFSVGNALLCFNVDIHSRKSLVIITFHTRGGKILLWSMFFFWVCCLALSIVHQKWNQQIRGIDQRERELKRRIELDSRFYYSERWFSLLVSCQHEESFSSICFYWIREGEAVGFSCIAVWVAKLYMRRGFW